MQRVEVCGLTGCVCRVELAFSEQEYNNNNDYTVRKRENR